MQFLRQILFFSLHFEQATAEQIRLAQMISDHNDADFEEKVKQVNKSLTIFVLLKMSYIIFFRLL